MNKQYFEMMQAHIDEGGQLSHRNGIDLLKEVHVLMAQVQLLKEAHTAANDALRSAWQVSEREGKETNWCGHREQVRYSLDVSHAAMASLTNGQRG